ncbi:MAG: LysM peptidoglycan-binding domain-containing protein [Proteobacteria bacterium]|nr:LysM peptidoglycan-binding domain-containing protein [Pseudomonadota bacterium]
MHYQLRKSITTLVFVLCSGLGTGALAQVAPSELKADAPDRYVVVPGDTLWSIAERFLSAPQRWPQLWNMNKETLKNPHRIYPGDVLVLDRAKGQLAVSDTVKLSPKVRAEGVEAKAIPSIPPNLIEPFLTRPLVIEPDGLDNAPTIVATEENRVILGAGNVAYVQGIGNSKEETWHVYRRGKALIDPDNNVNIGYEATFLGTARVRNPGEPATVEIVAAGQEITKGDKLVAAGRPPVPNYAPHAPAGQVRGRVMSIYGGVGEGGRNSVITLNRGKADGLEVGHVLALLRLGATVGEKRGMLGYGEAAPAGALKVPDERYGLVFVFRVFDRVSYALVMNVSRTVKPLDVVQNP